MVLEKIKRDKNRVDIADLNEDENAGDDLTGGYIVKIDKFEGSNNGGGWVSPYRPPGFQNNEQVIFFQFDYPKARNITTQQRQYIQDYVTAFEDALKYKPSSDQINGYKSLINLNSFVDFAIVNELSRNVDAYRLSTYLYKDKDSKDGKLYMGPLWDFNLGFGNANYYNASDIEGWAWSMNSNPDANNDYWLVPFWWQRFQTDPEYVATFRNRWMELRNGFFKTDRILAFIDSTATVLEESQERNFQKYNILNTYIWPNNFVGGSYQAEIDYLKNWVSARLIWIDQATDRMVTALPQEELLSAKFNAAPNPFTELISIEYVAQEDDLQFEIYTLSGKLMITMIASHNEAGGKYVWNGKDESGRELHPGMYILVIKENGLVVDSKKIIKN